MLRGRGRKLGHKWDNIDAELVAEECSICGLKRRNKTFYNNDMRTNFKGIVYFINGKWEHIETPICESK